MYASDVSAFLTEGKNSIFDLLKTTSAAASENKPAWCACPHTSFSLPSSPVLFSQVSPIFFDCFLERSSAGEANRYLGYRCYSIICSSRRVVGQNNVAGRATHYCFPTNRGDRKPHPRNLYEAGTRLVVEHIYSRATYYFVLCIELYCMYVWLHILQEYASTV